MDLAAVGIAGASLTSIAYLNAKYQLGKDFTSLMTGIQAKREWNARVKKSRISPWFLFLESTEKYAEHEALWTPERGYTFAETYTRSCQYASWLQQLGGVPRQKIAIYMENSADMVFLWMACWAIGACPAFINYNLTGDALAHTVKISTSTIIVSDVALAPNLHAVQDQFASDQTIYPLDEETKDRIFQMPCVRPDDSLAQIAELHDACIMLYTSGTSGFPKACPMSFNMLAFGMVARLKGGACTTPGPGGDRWYNCMPLYHGTGGISTLIAICGGITACLTKKFSVSNFWEEIRQSRATLFIYVGETARYLLSAPPSPLDKVHHVKGMYGNGMRPDVWTRFQERFGIDTVCEFFGASEGVLALSNRARGPFLATAVGHDGLLMRFLMRNKYFAAALDPETGDMQRDPTTGFVVPRSFPEGGELLYALADEREFTGYHENPAATEKRLARNVRRRGDVYYRTSDALRRDKDGRWFFMDRLGDTFRWKSENVSTTEVSAVMGQLPGIVEAVVYGVLVPGHDGRAGCARLYIPPGAQATVNYAQLLKALRQMLPKYAVPVFLRVSGKPAETTGNNKIIKSSLQKEGIDLELTSGEDRLLWAPPGANEYVEFTPADYSLTYPWNLRGKLSLLNIFNFILSTTNDCNMPPSERKGKTAPLATDDHQREKKRLQNRISQQCFREKQTTYIRHLEQFVSSIEKTDEFSSSDAAENLRLIRENHALRESLLQMRKKLLSLSAQAASMAKTGDEIIDKEPNSHESPPVECPALDPAGSETTDNGRSIDDAPTLAPSGTQGQQPILEGWIHGEDGKQIAQSPDTIPIDAHHTKEHATKNDAAKETQPEEASPYRIMDTDISTFFAGDCVRFSPFRGLIISKPPNASTKSPLLLLEAKIHAAMQQFNLVSLHETIAIRPFVTDLSKPDLQQIDNHILADIVHAAAYALIQGSRVGGYSHVMCPPEVFEKVLVWRYNPTSENRNCIELPFRPTEEIEIGTVVYHWQLSSVVEFPEQEAALSVLELFTYLANPTQFSLKGTVDEDGISIPLPDVTARDITDDLKELIVSHRLDQFGERKLPPCIAEEYPFIDMMNIESSPRLRCLGL
ncbi:hypothetical protein FE257_001011 [Aspergillus nanangensis]|uniref:BZIP domain-containing protein n=1 Tax=Aspergillus nanangensis TaxID=2582783 RepID=A0AAD4CTV6_ASPNN|nr:hypothetical protein FE257_001011 [Aspergillus nanangensis]